MNRKYQGRFTRRLWKEFLLLKALGAVADHSDTIRLTRNGQYPWLVILREFFDGVNNFRDLMRHHIRAEREAFDRESPADREHPRERRSPARFNSLMAGCALPACTDSPHCTAMTHLPLSTILRQGSASINITYKSYRYTLTIDPPAHGTTLALFLPW